MACSCLPKAIPARESSGRCGQPIQPDWCRTEFSRLVSCIAHGTSSAHPLLPMLFELSCRLRPNAPTAVHIATRRCSQCSLLGLPPIFHPTLRRLRRLHMHKLGVQAQPFHHHTSAHRPRYLMTIALPAIKRMLLPAMVCQRRTTLSR